MYDQHHNGKSVIRNNQKSTLGSCMPPPVRNHSSGSLSQKLSQWTKRISMNSSTKSSTRSASTRSSSSSKQQRLPSSTGSHQRWYAEIQKPKTSPSKNRSKNHKYVTHRSNNSSSSHNRDYQDMMPDKYAHASFEDIHTVKTASTAATTIRSFSIDDTSTVVSESGTEIIMPTKDRILSPYSSHSFRAGNENFTVDKKYSLIRVIGSGAYGTVISAHDSSTKSKVAIKMVPRAFNDEIDAKRILREIKLLKHFCHENIVGMTDMMPPTVSCPEEFNDVYLVVDLMETDLHRIIYSKQSLSIDHVQYFLYQLLRALKYIHSANVIHRDLKPSNVLVNSNCDLKVCDFGLARGIHPKHDYSQVGDSQNLTEYVVTRWYRAPEIMLACHEYSKPVDVWSVGCIFAELLARKPFFPGEDYIDQLTIISEKLGKPPEEDLDFVTSEKAKKFMKRLPEGRPLSLRRQFPGTPPEALDLLSKLLQIHPRKRITVTEALAHPFLKNLHCPEDEPTAEAPFNFDFEKEKLHRVRLQELIWDEIGDFRPSCLPVPPRRDDVKARGKLHRLYHA